MVVLPILGFDLFRSKHASLRTDRDDKTPLFDLEAVGAHATAREVDGEFIVLAGSTARKEGTKTFPDAYRTHAINSVRTVSLSMRPTHIFIISNWMCPFQARARRRLVSLREAPAA